ncbi:MAG: hypothetical protein WCC87_09115 [Candidatus Korobacteraceae bacterium]
MELLLNLVWFALGMAGFLIFIRSSPRSNRQSVSYRRSLLALACVLLLLFPVVSASDDLHPTQTLMEEASRRISPHASVLRLSHDRSTTPLVPPLLSLVVSLLLALTMWQPWQPVETKTRSLSGYRLCSRGRAPPAFGD